MSSVAVAVLALLPAFRRTWTQIDTAAVLPRTFAQALSCALEVPVEVFSATSPPLLLGENFDGAPLMLTYHEHYYALGAHYNSVVPL